MERSPKNLYSPEFREQAISLCQEEKLGLTETAKRLSFPTGTLKNWAAIARQGKLGNVGKRQKLPSDLELAKVKRGLAEVKMERGLLKKCAAYFARASA
jgi:transposase